MYGETWTLTEHLLAAAVDALNIANWQRSSKGKRPDPLPRPGQKKPARAAQALPVEELRARLRRKG